MKYILIIGNGYRDCKAKFDKIKKEPETKYPFVTKVKHLSALEDNEYLLTDVAKENPNFDDIIKTITQKETKPVEDVKNKYKEERDKRWDEIVSELKEKEKWKEVEPELVEEEITTDVPLTEPAEDEFMFEKEYILTEPNPDVAPEIDELPIEDQPEDLPKLEPEVEVEPEPEVSEPEPEPEVVEEESVIEEEVIPEVEVEPEPEVSEPEIMEELVVEEVSIDETPEPEVVEEELVENIKPINPPRGWHARKLFIDEVGNKFVKGKFVGNENE